MEKIALALMTVGTLFAIWSSVNPSYFTIKKFGVTQEDKKLIIEGVIIAIIVIVVTLVGVYLAMQG